MAAFDRPGPPDGVTETGNLIEARRVKNIDGASERSCRSGPAGTGITDQEHPPDRYKTTGIRKKPDCQDSGYGLAWFIRICAELPGREYGGPGWC